MKYTEKKQEKSSVMKIKSTWWGHRVENILEINVYFKSNATLNEKWVKCYLMSFLVFVQQILA